MGQGKVRSRHFLRDKERSGCTLFFSSLHTARHYEPLIQEGQELRQRCRTGTRGGWNVQARERHLDEAGGVALPLRLLGRCLEEF